MSLSLFRETGGNLKGTVGLYPHERQESGKDGEQRRKKSG